MASNDLLLPGETVPPKTSRKRKRWSAYTAYKTLVVIYGFLFFVLGLLLLGLGLWLETLRKGHTSIIDVLTSLSVLTIIIGGVMLLTAFCAIIGALKESLLLVKIFMAAAILVFILQVTIGIMAFVFQQHTDTMAERNFMDALVKYNSDEGATRAIDFVQEKLKCCGVHNAYDWDMNEDFTCHSSGIFSCGVPDSCCRAGSHNYHTIVGCGRRIRASVQGRKMKDKLPKLRQLGINTKGCYVSFVTWIKNSLHVVGGAAIGYTVVHIFGILFVYLLYTRLEDRRRLFNCNKPASV